MRHSSRSLIPLLIAVLVLGVLWYQREQHRPEPVPLRAASSQQAFEENHFSPSENLEQLDLEHIERAEHSLDIAMYAFTDKYLAEAIVRAAERGVRVRIYRDRSQYEQEQQNADRFQSESTTTMLGGQDNIQIRVKRSRELMHLKSYLVDAALLRDGSANWSASGLKRQDNNVRFTSDPAQVREFLNIFEEMWSRPDNEVVQ